LSVAWRGVVSFDELEEVRIEHDRVERLVAAQHALSLGLLFDVPIASMFDWYRHSRQGIEIKRQRTA
jgi:hypothetical protein